MNDTLVSCTVGSDEYALRAADIVAVLRADRMRAPAASETAVGAVTVGSERVAVQSLSATLRSVSHTPDFATDRERHIVVLRSGGGVVGWLVDHVGRSHLPARTPVLPMPAALGVRAAQWFGGVLSTDERTMLVLSLTPAASAAVEIAAPDAHAAADAQGKTSQARPLVVTFDAEALPRCSAAEFAVSARRVIGLESGVHVASVPGSDYPFTGVAVWRNEVVPVLDFRVAANRRADEHRLLIVGCTRSAWGTSLAIPIGTESALHQPGDDDRVVGTPEMMADEPSFVTGLFDVRGRRIALVDPDLLMAAAVAARGGMFTSRTLVQNPDEHVGAARA